MRKITVEIQSWNKRTQHRSLYAQIHLVLTYTTELLLVICVWKTSYTYKPHEFFVNMKMCPVQEFQKLLEYLNRYFRQNRLAVSCDWMKGHTGKTELVLSVGWKRGEGH